MTFRTCQSKVLFSKRSVKMIEGSEKRNRQLAFELQNSHVCEKRSKAPLQTDATSFANNSQLCCMLHVASVFYTLLGVVAQSLKPVKLLATYKPTQPPPTMLGVVGNQCCIRFHRAYQVGKASLCSHLNPHGRIDGMEGKILRVPSIPLTLVPFIFNF